MINHLRTVLLNSSSSAAFPPNYPGEEYVPPTYTPKTLSGNLAAVCRLLFGLSPDRAMLNYRLRELLAILHSCELAEYVYQLDPRVTYLPQASDIVDSAITGPVVTNLIGTQSMYLLGQLPPQSNDTLYFDFTVTVINGAQVSIINTNLTAPATIAPYVITSGLSNIISFPNTDVGFQFQAGVGASWRIVWLAQPQRTLGVTYNNLLSGLTTDLQDELFGLMPEQPYLSWKNLWLENPYMSYQLGGVTLALGYRINDLLR